MDINDDKNKALEVFDQPLLASAVRRQKQHSFYEHIDKECHSRVIEVEPMPEDPMPEVLLAKSGATIAIESIRCLPAGKDEDTTNETNINKKNSPNGTKFWLDDLQ